MDTKWKKSKAVLGFAAFLLGVSMLLEGGLFFWSSLSSYNSRQWVWDSFRSDWRNTREFKNYISNRLEKLITMGAGGWVYGETAYYDGGDWSDYATRARSIHNAWKEDKNLLYRVEKDSKELYSNTDILRADQQPSSLSDKDYGFLLVFDGEKVRIWQDGEELNVYGSGYYNYDRAEDFYQWYVPGYKNFTVDEAGSHVKVTMAVINTPRVFIKGSYGKNGSESYNELYYLKQNLESCRETVIARAVCTGVGLALFLVYVLLRKDKARADRLLARGTGKLWFEVKLLLAAALLIALLPHGDEFGQVWREAYWSVTAQNPVAEAVDGGVEYWSYNGGGLVQAEAESGFGTAVTVISENADWLLRTWVQELCSRPAALLLCVWGIYLLIVNDWRYNKKPWRRGIVGMLCAWGLKRPIQKRLSRASGLTALALVLLGAVNLDLLVYASVSGWGRVQPETVMMLCSPAALLLLITAAFLWRQRRLWTDLGAVSDRVSAIRAGELEQELRLPPDHDLHGLADDLNHISQGLHQAVEERTRSERMKVELVTNVSHDLKTPLTSIISYAELLEQENLEPPAGEYVRILSDKAQRLKTMVQDVFEVSKAASGQLPVKLERLDYARLLRQTLADMDGAIADSGLTLRTGIPEGEVPITADSDRMYRVFQNLIGNALKYSLPASRVYLTLAVENGAATASVKNTSAAELRPGADYTARFVRGDLSRSDGGSGLGLSIADSFTKACGGTLTVSTEADLFTVSVSFPLADS